MLPERRSPIASALQQSPPRGRFLVNMVAAHIPRPTGRAGQLGRLPARRRQRALKLRSAVALMGRSSQRANARRAASRCPRQKRARLIAVLVATGWSVGGAAGPQREEVVKGKGVLVRGDC